MPKKLEQAKKKKKKKKKKKQGRAGDTQKAQVMRGCHLSAQQSRA